MPRPSRNDRSRVHNLARAYSLTSRNDLAITNNNSRILFDNDTAQNGLNNRFNNMDFNNNNIQSMETSENIEINIHVKTFRDAETQTTQFGTSNC